MRWSRASTSMRRSRSRQPVDRRFSQNANDRNYAVKTTPEPLPKDYRMSPVLRYESIQSGGLQPSELQTPCFAREAIRRFPVNGRPSNGLRPMKTHLYGSQLILTNGRSSSSQVSRIHRPLFRYRLPRILFFYSASKGLGTSLKIVIHRLTNQIGHRNIKRSGALFPSLKLAGGQRCRYRLGAVPCGVSGCASHWTSSRKLLDTIEHRASI